MATEKEVIDFIQEQIPGKNYQPNMSLSKNGLDHLDSILLMLKLEDQFELDMPGFDKEIGTNEDGYPIYEDFSSEQTPINIATYIQRITNKPGANERAEMAIRKAFETFGYGELDSKKTLIEQGLDSLDLFEFYLKVERILGTPITPDEHVSYDIPVENITSYFTDILQKAEKEEKRVEQKREREKEKTKSLIGKIFSPFTK